MRSKKVLIWISAAGGYTGLGMLLGYVLGNQTNTTPLWIGLILVLLAAVLCGMYLSARNARVVKVESERSD